MSMSRKVSDLRVYKIIVIGDSGVGKTCLTFRFCSGKFPGKTEGVGSPLKPQNDLYKSCAEGEVTIGVDFREKIVEIDSEAIKLQLWDTAGQERFRKSMIQHYYRNVHAVVFVYDVTNPASFDSLPAWISECEKHRLTQDVPRLIIGNKLDCGLQLVSTNMAQKFADCHHMPLFETSALDDSHANHVDSIFMTLAHKLKASKPMMSPVSSGLGSGVPSPSIVLQRNDSDTGTEEESDTGSCSC